MERADIILAFHDVTGKRRKFHLQNINMGLQAGYIYGLIGENGAGKTTLMRYILDESAAYEGEIFVDGEDIKENHAALMNKIGYVSEDNRFLGDRTGKQNAELLGIFYDAFSMEIFMESMKTMGVSATKTYRLMSRGEQLKFQLAFAMAHQPRLYLLDEVTAGMDAVFRREFFGMLRELIREENCSILMTSHILSEIERETDYVALMERGTIVQFGESLDVGKDWKEKSHGQKNAEQ